jgi:unsaturated chondroitin disaccharide hydrolase
MTNYRVLEDPLPLVAPAGVQAPAGYVDAVENAWYVAETKVRALVGKHPDRFPLYTADGHWSVEGDAWTNWCEGFLAGQLWLLAERTGDKALQSRAEHYSLLIEPRKTDRDVHDLGFLFWSSWKRWFDSDGDPRLDGVVVAAGETLAMRFNEKGRYLRSFLATDSLFVDIMMNVGIIFYASSRTGDENLARIAYEHCLTTRRYLVRGDGSASHEGIFDLETGRFLRQTTQQGWRDDGSWARGQAWSIYGFGTAYRFTGDRRFLATAAACADFYIERTGDQFVPPNDWEEPDPTRPFESSAAAIAAAGIWQLACLTQDTLKAGDYGDYALGIQRRLLGDEFLANEHEPWEGILKHGSYHEAKGLGVDESVMWGDYFLLDGLTMVAATLDLEGDRAAVGHSR